MSEWTGAEPASPLEAEISWKTMREAHRRFNLDPEFRAKVYLAVSMVSTSYPADRVDDEVNLAIGAVALLLAEADIAALREFR